MAIQLRRDLAAQWTAVNPTLASGEIGYETDTGLFKIGPGIWNALPYANAGVGGGAVSSVNGQTGAVVLDAGDVGADPAGTAAAAVSAHAAASNPHAGVYVRPGDLADVATSGAYADLTGRPAPYTLPVADAGTLGGVRIGSGINVSPDGTISAAAQPGTGTDLSYDAATRLLASSSGADVTLPLAGGANAGLMASADFTKLTGIAPGAEVNVVDSVNGQTGAVVLDAADVGAATAVQGALADSALQPGEAATPAQGALADTALQPGDLPAPYTLPAATAGTLGGVRIGSGITVSGDGTISAEAQPGTGTDLSYTASTRLLASSSGADVTLPEVVAGGNSGLMTGAQATKLAGIESSADVTDQTNVLAALDGATVVNATLQDSLAVAAALTDGATPVIDAEVAPIRTWTLGANGRTPSITWGDATAARMISLLITGNGFDTINWSTIAPTWVGTEPTISSTGVTAVSFLRVNGVTYGFGGVGAGSGSEAVDSVNGETGVVVLDAADVGAATAAQGALADSAVQPGDLATVATTGAYGDLTGQPSIPSTPGDIGAATSAQGALADSAIQPGNAALTDAREWTAATIAQAEAEAGTATTRRAFTAQRVRQAITAWWATVSGTVATAAQGALADSALQPGDLATVAETGEYIDLNGRPTLGTAAAAATTDFATAAQGALADTALQPGGALGTPASGTLTNCTGLPVSGIVEGATLTRTIAAGTAAMGTAAIASGADATVVTVAAAGVLATDVIDWGFNGNPNGVTGFNAADPDGCLVITLYPTAGNVNFVVSNPTAASITPGALTLNWRVTR